MSFDTSFLAHIKQRVPLHQVIESYVVWDKHKTNAAKGDYWAPCPFHNEKNASFHVTNSKGSYYCFGCGAKGDAVSFLTDLEKLPFMQAVEKLASMAGVAMPTRQTPSRTAPDATMRAVLELAQQTFLTALHAPIGQNALQYVRGRGLGADQLNHFGMGYAAPERYHLRDVLRRAGFTDADGVRAGVLIAGNEGDSPYDRFRDRIMFPIHDAAGKLISFAGRALSAQAQAKYLNGPETPLFYKGETLFYLHNARRAAAKSGRLLVCEGYMDVVALHRVGIADAVAPMGTALTEHQLMLLWRHAPEPFIVFDGDAAGQRAALRALDLALPLLQPGRSLQFVFLPQGQDPDDVVGSGGANAIEALLAQAMPLSAYLFKRTFLEAPLDTPERLAAAAARLKQDIASIAHEQVRQFYTADMRQRWSQWRGESAPEPVFIRKRLPYNKSYTPPTPPAPQNSGSKAREYMLLGMIIAHPALLPQVVESLANLPLHDIMAQHARTALLTLDSAAKQGTLKQMLVETWNNGAEAIGDMLARVPKSFLTLSTELAYARWSEEADFHCTRSGIRHELKQAANALSVCDDTQTLQRVRFLQNAQHGQPILNATPVAPLTKF